jgi:hypothetical protein
LIAIASGWVADYRPPGPLRTPGSSGWRRSRRIVHGDDLGELDVRVGGVPLVFAPDEHSEARLLNTSPRFPSWRSSSQPSVEYDAVMVSVAPVAVETAGTGSAPDGAATWEKNGIVPADLAGEFDERAGIERLAQDDVVVVVLICDQGGLLELSLGERLQASA